MLGSEVEKLEVYENDFKLKKNCIGAFFVTFLEKKEWQYIRAGTCLIYLSVCLTY